MSRNLNLFAILNFVQQGQKFGFYLGNGHLSGHAVILSLARRIASPQAAVELTAGHIGIENAGDPELDAVNDIRFIDFRPPAPRRSDGGKTMFQKVRWRE